MTPESSDDPAANGHTKTPSLDRAPSPDQKPDHDSKGAHGDDPEQQQLKKLPYPKSVFFIISNEFCERFSYYGMRTILSIYLTNVLFFSEPDAKIVYHTFNIFTYLFPLFGAIISDSWLGKFRTIMYVSIIYAIGNIVLALASAEPLNLPMTPISLLGLFLIAVGTGGIKPCVSSFGGDQFVLPQQEKQLVVFFSIFYFCINSGSLISTFLTPVLRENVHCFGNDTCYPVAFAVPGALMIVSIVIFAAGRPMYRVRKPEGNVIVKVSSCITHALKQKYRSKEKKEHWLDYAEDKFGSKLVKEIKITLKVLVVFVPLPIFWALYDQQGSGWTFQAVRMNGDLGGYTILPDQMQVVNSVLILIFIPLFSYGVYPMFAKCNLFKTPLQKMVCGGFLTAGSFLISAGVSVVLESTYPVLPSDGNAQLRLYNPLPCNAQIDIPLIFPEGPKDFGTMSYLKTTVKMKGELSYPYTITGCEGEIANITGSIVLKEKKAKGYFMSTEGFLGFEDDVDKDVDGMPLIRTLVNREADDFRIQYMDGKHVEKTVGTVNHTLYAIAPGTYKVRGSDTKLEILTGAIYTVLVTVDDALQVTNVKMYEITAPNSVHMLWLLPQYFVITAGEIMFSITGLEFSYSQAPVSMKSVMTSAFLLTTAVGNLLIVIIESIKIFDLQSSDFFLWAGIMVADMLVFMWLCTGYTYIEKDEISESEEQEERPSVKAKELSALDNPAFTDPKDDDS